MKSIQVVVLLLCLSVPISLVRASAASAEEPKPAESSLSEVVVSGTRLATGAESPTPVLEAPTTVLQLAAPGNLADALNQLPQFLDSNSPTRYTNNGNNSVSGNFLNLRGVGAMRSLVLLDGQRVVPTTAGDSTQVWVGSVDADTLPQLLIKRVDIVTAGASAAYGSDALSGVVNFILDKNFTGFKGVAQGGESTHGDDGSYRVGAAFGTEFAEEKGHVEFSIERYHSNGIPDRSDRPAGRPVYISAGAGTAADPIHTVAGARFSIMTDGGFAMSGPFAGQQFLPDGELAPFNAGVPLTSTGPYQIGGDGAYIHQQSLAEALQTTQAFARLSYRVTDRLNTYAQLSYSDNRNDYNNLTNFSFPGMLTVFSGNAFLTPGEQQQLTATNTDSISVARFYPEVGPMNITSSVRTLSATAGMDADLGRGWTLDAHYTYGRSNFDSLGNNFFETQRFYAAVDAVRDSAGSIVCRVTLTNPGLYPGCVPFDALGEGAASTAAVAYVTGQSMYAIRNEMNDVALNIRGNPFSLWAGPVAFASGLEVRDQSLLQTSNSGAQADTTGLRGDGQSGDFFIGNAGTADGSESTKEVYAETDVPLLARLPLAKALNINGAVRYADYSITGHAVTWKAGLVYQPYNDLRVRITRSSDFRAPSLYDLFAGSLTNPTILDDPHTGVSEILPGVKGGNRNLLPETGNTITGGFVYQPQWLQGFSGSIDYYRLRITNLITTLGADRIAILCEQAGGTGAYCDLVHRPLPWTDTSPANFPTSVSTPSVNAAFASVSGVDFDFSYRRTVPRGMLSARAVASYLARFEDQDYPGGAILESAGLITHASDDALSHPRWHGALNMTYNAGAFTAFVQEQFIGTGDRGNTSLGIFSPGQDGQGGGGQVYAKPKVPAVFYTDVTLSYDIAMASGQVSLFTTVNNLFDKQPPIIPRASLPQLDYPTIPYVYDVIGRYMTAGVRVRF